MKAAVRWPALVSAGAWTAVFAVWIGLRPVPQTVVGFDDVATSLTAVAAGALGAMAASRLRGRLRAAWALIGAGCASWGVGNIVWTYYELVLRRPVPTPSAADLFYLGAVPLTALGVLLLLAPPRRPALLLRAVTDGAIIAGALFLISWGTVGGAVVASAGDNSLGLCINLAYPLGDVVILTAAIFAAGYSTRAVRPIVLCLAAGWFSFGLADSSFAYATALHFYSTGNPLDIGWVAGLSLVGAAAALAPGVEWPAPAADSRPPVSPLAIYPVLVAALVYRVAAFGTAPIPAALTVIGLAVISLVLFRQVLISVDARALERERQAAMNALRTSEQRLTQVLDNSATSVFAFDAEGRCVLSRGSAVPNPEQQIGKRVSEFTSREARAIFGRALAGEATMGQVQAANGRVLELRCTPVLEGGEVRGIVGVGLDVTERVEAEEARRESAAKDRFLANMSHELRTPLNSILGFAQLLGREDFGTLNERQLRYQGNILTSGAQLLDLINELLDLSKVRAGELDVQLEPVVIHSILTEAVDSVRPQADAAGLRLIFEPPAELVARADSRRLRQVLLNILSNAVKFTPPGGAIHVAAVATGGEVRIEIADTGIGIPEADRDRIFEEFTQLDAGRKRSGAGTGLGLALARALARRMGGEVTVARHDPAGSVFSVSLPAAT